MYSTDHRLHKCKKPSPKTRRAFTPRLTWELDPKTGLTCKFIHSENPGNLKQTAENPQNLKTTCDVKAPARNAFSSSSGFLPPNQPDIDPEYQEITIKELQELTGLNYRTVLRRVRKLEQFKVIETTKKGGILFIQYHLKKEDLIRMIKYLPNSPTKPLNLIITRELDPNVKPIEDEKDDFKQHALYIHQKYQLLNDKGQEEVKRSYTRWLNMKRDPDYLKYNISTENRFNTPSIPIKQLKKAEVKAKEYCSTYDEAIFITLTTDPKRFHCLFEANTHIRTAWNLFTRKLKRSDDYPIFSYVKCIEYTKTGLAHIHAILFGISFIPVKVLSYIWSKVCNQGKIVYANALELKDNSLHWKEEDTPTGNYHKDIGRHSPISYLTKNLNSLINNPYLPELSGYWIYKQQIVTTSRH